MARSICLASSSNGRSQHGPTLRRRDASVSAIPIFCVHWDRATRSTIRWFTKSACSRNGSACASRLPLLELLQLLRDRRCGERQVFAVALHRLLPFARKDVTQEFARLWIDRLAMLALQVVIHVARQRVAAGLNVIERELYIRI